MDLLKADPATWTFEQFGEVVDFFTALYGLDPTFYPELLWLKDPRRASMVVGPDGNPMRYLRMLNPHIGVSHQSGTGGPLVIDADPEKQLLMEWNLARYHIPGLVYLIDRVVADASGTTLYAQGEILAIFPNGAIGPDLSSEDKKEHYLRAASIINDFTGRIVDYLKLMEAGAQRIVVTLTSTAPERWATDAPCLT